jgi:hypothetical protein
MDAVLEYNAKQVIVCDCDPVDCVQSWLLAGNWYELDLLQMLDKLQICGNYLDIGAYVGTFSLFSSLFCPSDNIYAIEPQLDIYSKLVRNIEANNINKCKTFNIAISDYNGRGQMTHSDTNHGGSRLVAGVEVEVATLDSLQIPNIKVVKIDVENGELDVLRGGQNTISNANHLFIEVWPESTCQRYNVPYVGKQVADLLASMGFSHQCELSGDNHYWKK